MNYRLSRSAEKDLSGIWDYSVRTWGIAQAERYLNQLEVRFSELAVEPSKGRQQAEVHPDYWCYHEAKHLIFYRPYEGGIAIARVLHERMDVASRLDDDPGVVDG